MPGARATRALWASKGLHEAAGQPALDGSWGSSPSSIAVTAGERRLRKHGDETV